MLNFTLYQPTYYAFGRDTQHRAGELARRFGATRVLLHYGGGSVVRSGLLDQVKKSLDDAGLFWVELGGARPNPRASKVREGVALCRKEKLDFVLSVGGGSAIDSGKAIAAGACYDGDFWDLFLGKAPYVAALRHGCVLTLPATGTEGSNSAVITEEEGLMKRGTNNDLNRPAFSILNPEFTYTLPAYQTACGAVDMLAHIIERYFTNTTDVDLTDRLCESTMQAVLQAAPVAMKKPDDYQARATLMWAGTIAHNGTLGVGREEDWASHRIEHELSALYDVAHGAGLAVVIPNWMRYTLDAHVMRYAQFATRVMGCTMCFEDPRRTALEGIDRLQAFFKSLNMPLTFADLGAKEEDIPTMVSKIPYAPDGTTGHFSKLTPKDVENIYRLCCQA